MKKGRSTERKEQTKYKTKKQKKGGFEWPCMLLRFKTKRERKNTQQGRTKSGRGGRVGSKIRLGVQGPPRKLVGCRGDAREGV